jgi:hypothetical protein
MTAMRVAEETIQRAVPEREDPLANSASGTKRRETAPASKEMKGNEELSQRKLIEKVMSRFVDFCHSRIPRVLRQCIGR